jgi:3-deoxy-7-phosphoheptulonate synthase
MTAGLTGVTDKVALQQPNWDDHVEARRITEQLAVQPPLVAAEDIYTLRTLLGKVAAGEVHVVQAGDCAEDPAECTIGYVARKCGLLDVLAGTLQMNTHRPVLRVGRIAGQYVKPRTKMTEFVGGVEMPFYRGHMVNSPEPDPELRKADPKRLLTGYRAANEVIKNIGWHDPGYAGMHSVWTSHEALLLDYELPMLRRDERGNLLLTSTHWPWIGERTRQLDGAHVALLAQVANPVACKIGPSITDDELIGLCERLDPDREPGRLTLIVRMGAATIAERLPGVVELVRHRGHPVIWLTDPMHGNTVMAPDGQKTRYLETIVCEVQAFQRAVRDAGGVAGGLHLETTPDAVTEVVLNAEQLDEARVKYTSLCDPRLRPDQAVSVVSAWTG